VAQATVGPGGNGFVVVSIFDHDVAQVAEAPLRDELFDEVLLQQRPRARNRLRHAPTSTYLLLLLP
jgi:hypothetical protein